MKAAVTRQWERIEVMDRETPALRDGECLVRVRYAGICGSDVHIFQGHHPTAKAPVVQGHEFVGTLEQIGPGVATEIKVGERVVVEPLISCGRCEACRAGHHHVCRKLGLLGIHADGAFAEKLRVLAEKMIRVPEELSDRVAALAEPFAVGFHVCSRGELRNGDRALIVGAGPIGLIIGIVARLSGASVTFAEIQPARIEQAKAMGFAAFNSGGDPAAIVGEATGGDGFDVVFEVSGSAPGVLLATELCRARGRVVQVGFFGKRPEADLMKVIFKELSIIGSRVYTLEDFRRTVPMLARIVREKHFDVESLIDSTCGLDGVESSIGRMIRGECKGKILVDLGR